MFRKVDFPTRKMDLTSLQEINIICKESEISSLKTSSEKKVKKRT
jgi:hypothetical protein